MQHKRSRLTTKILAFVLILALVFPASAFASVADVAKDTRAPGKSLANTYPAYTDIDWQISLAENAQAEVTVPTNMTAEELGTAMNGGLTLSLDRDSTRGYLDPEKFPYPYQGGALDTWMTQWKQDKQPQNLFRITDMGMGHFPVCMAKTQYSLSDDPKKLGRPSGFTVNVREVYVSAGAEFVVAVNGSIMTMPGLPKVPAAEKIDVDETGKITGLF